MPTTTLILDAKAQKLWRAFQRTHREQDKTIRKGRELGRESKQGQEQMAASADALGQSLGRTVAKLTGLGGGLATATAAIHKMYSEWRAEAEETATKASELHTQIIDAMFLADNVADEKFRQKLHARAALYGVPGGAAEVARGQYMLQSATGGLPAAQQQALFREMLEFRQTTSLGLEEMAPLFADPANLFRGELAGMDPAQMANTVQNVIKRTIDLAKTTPAALRQSFPRVLGAGVLGGLSFRETAALFARSTALTGTTQQAATGLENLIITTMFPGLPPEEQEQALATMTPAQRARAEAILAQQGPADIESIAQLYQAAGISPETDFMGRLRKLSALGEEGGFTPEMQVKLWGRRGVRVGAGMMKAGLTGLEDFLADYARTTGPEQDIVAAGLRTRTDIDPRFRLQLLKQKEAARLAAEKLADEDIAVADELTVTQMESDLRSVTGGRMQPQDYLNLSLRKLRFWARRFLHDVTESSMDEPLGDAPGAPDYRAEQRREELMQPRTRRQYSWRRSGYHWETRADGSRVQRFHEFGEPMPEHLTTNMPYSAYWEEVPVEGSVGPHREEIVGSLFRPSPRGQVEQMFEDQGMMGPPAPELRLENVGTGPSTGLYRGDQVVPGY